MNLSLQMVDISVNNQRANFNIGPYDMGTPLKIEILTIMVVHPREDQKIATEPNFHAPKSSSGKD